MTLDKLKAVVQKMLDVTKATPSNMPEYYAGQETAYQSVLDTIENIEEEEKKEKAKPLKIETWVIIPGRIKP